VQAELAAMARDIRDTKAWVEAKLVPSPAAPDAASPRRSLAAPLIVASIGFLCLAAVIVAGVRWLRSLRKKAA